MLHLYKHLTECIFNSPSNKNYQLQNENKWLFCFKIYLNCQRNVKYPLNLCPEYSKHFTNVYKNVHKQIKTAFWSRNIVSREIIYFYRLL